MTKLSVVVAAKNVAPWLHESLASIAGQGIDAMEVIVVDDGSSDGSAEIADQWRQADPRFRVLHTPGLGGGAARNAGVDQATGEYLCFCDGDDLVPDGAYRAMISRLDSSGSDLVIGDFLKFNSVDTWSPTSSMGVFSTAHRGVTLDQLPGILLSRACWNKVFRREFWVSRRLRFPDAVRANDIVPIARAYLSARAIDLVQDVVYLYRERPGRGSMTYAAGTADGTLSYLRQETAVARDLKTASSAVAVAYRELLFERDLPVHLSKYLRETVSERSEAGSAAGDVAVASAVRDLLAVGPPPDARSSSVSRAIVEQVAAGHLARADAIRRVLFDTAGGASVAEVLSLVADVSDDRTFGSAIGSSLAQTVVDTLGDMSVDNPASGADWVALADAATTLWGAEATRCVPELRRGSPPAAGAAHTLRWNTSAIVRRVRGGASATVWAEWAVNEPGAMPVLISQHAPEVVVFPQRVISHRTDRDRRHAIVEFSQRGLRLNYPYVIAVAVHDQCVAALTTDSRLSGYDPFASLAVEAQGRRLLVIRRPHWIVRAAGLIARRCSRALRSIRSSRG